MDFLKHSNGITFETDQEFPEGFTLAQSEVRHQEWKRLPDKLATALYGKAFIEDMDRIAQATERHVNVGSMWNLRNLLRFAVDGPVCELGVYRGATAKVLSERDELWLVDSFEGLSAPSIGDAMSAQGGIANAAWGDFSYDVEKVRECVPHAHIVKGWVPECLSELPEQRWAFVHIDLDMFDPTYHAAKYFIPRMLPGGVIVEDQYVSSKFPGAGRAWEHLGVKLDVLPTGQGVLLI